MAVPLPVIVIKSSELPSVPVQTPSNGFRLDVALVLVAEDVARFVDVCELSLVTLGLIAPFGFGFADSCGAGVGLCS
jgi:hypothetical protein